MYVAMPVLSHVAAHDRLQPVVLNERRMLLSLASNLVKRDHVECAEWRVVLSHSTCWPPKASGVDSLAEGFLGHASQTQGWLLLLSAHPILVPTRFRKANCGNGSLASGKGICGQMEWDHQLSPPAFLQLLERQFAVSMG